MAEAPNTEFDGRIPVTPITAERYISPEYLAREWQRLWPNVWLVAGVEQDVAEPGDYFVFDLDPESIIVSRTESNELAALYNVCQHRGARIVLSERGSMAEYTCPYHGWRYANDGTLVHAPDADRFSRGVPSDTLSLKSVRVEAWAGAIWICMDPDAPSLDEFLGPVKEMVAPFRGHEMKLYEDQTVSLNCNWKAVFDNFGELYHVEHIHPQHETIFDCPASVSELMDQGHTRVLIDGFTVNTQLPIPEEVPPSQWSQMKALGMDKDDYTGRVLDVRRDIQIKKRELGSSLGYNYDLLSDEQLSDIVQYNIFPNSILVLQPEEMWILRSRPHATDPNKCYWDKLSLHMYPDPKISKKANLTFNLRKGADGEDGLPPVVDRPEHDSFTQEDIIAGRKTMTITLDQDIHFIRDVQRGMHSRGFTEAWLNDDESRVQHYHTWLDRHMED
jgi:phenylpropionate dioxygenase-like ring-hydroxylating dioxygenase large terminal subunit